MDDTLRQLAFAEGGTSNLTTEELMVAKIKSLTVISLHSSVHIVNLHELKQNPDETVQTLSAKLRVLQSPVT